MYIVYVYYIFKVIFKIDGALLSTLSLSIFFALLTIVAILLGITAITLAYKHVGLTYDPYLQF